jgi:acyl-CoA synthetase (AMP-forming)/AMP-acid ligase II
MTMQQTPLIMSRLLFRGATVQPDEAIVTLTADGVRRQTNRRDARPARHQLAHALAGCRCRRSATASAPSCGTGARHLEAYHAIACMGAVLHTLNIRLSDADLEYIVNHAEDKVIIVDADLLPKLEALEGSHADGREGDRRDGARLEGWDHDPARTPSTTRTSSPASPTDYAWPEIDENAPLGLCYTSGTTGKPKGVMYTHRSNYLHTMAISMTDVMGLSASTRCCGIVPMFHANAWGLPWVATMLGMKQVYPASLHGRRSASRSSCPTSR